MRARYWIVAGLFVAGVLAVLLLRPRPSPGSRGVPQAALDAVRDGRYLRATQILRGELKAAQDTSAETILLLARAEAGWGDWPQVERLLAGRSWLDQVEGGLGRELLGRSLLARGDWAAGARELGRYLDVAEGLTGRERGIALVREAQALQRQGREAAALEAYDRAAGELPPIKDWIGWLAAGAAADAGDTAQVRARLQPLPAALARDRGWSLRVRAAARARDTTAALAAALSAAGSLPVAAGRAAAWELAGEMRRRRGDAAGARTAFDAALTLAPGSGAGTAAARALLSLAPTPGQRLRAARALLRAGDAANGAPALRVYLAGARLPSARRSALLLELGNGLFAAGRYSDAIVALRAGLASAAPDLAAGTLYTVARAQLRLGREADTRATLLRLVELYPASGAAASAFFLLGDMEQDAGHALAAAAYFGRATGVRGAASVAGDAFMRLGEIQMAGRDWAAAVRTYETYRGRYPAGEHREQATYWVARAYARLDATDRARARLQELGRGGSLSYYALRAAELLGQPPLPTGPAAPAPSGAAARRRVAAGALRIELLHDLGLDEAADAEGRALQARLGTDDAALYDLAEALDALGLTSAGERIGWALRRRAPDWNPRLLRIVYPFPYRDAIVAESRARGLDPYLVAGLIRQESGFDARARSRVGAVGLMQVMPATARTLARGAGTGTFDVGMLERPELNVQLGTAFVADMLRRTNGRVAQMLAAYNAGPARLDRWRRFPEAGDPELFAERIPYDETRQYVKIVQANARIYAALYPGLAAPAVAGG